MEFGERLRQARKEKGLTQKEMAERLHIAGSTYAGYETGFREPGLFKLKEIINELGVDSSWLLGVDDLEGLTADEYRHIKKYRALDERGRETVDAVLEQQYQAMLRKKAEADPVPMQA